MQLAKHLLLSLPIIRGPFPVMSRSGRKCQRWRRPTETNTQNFPDFSDGLSLDFVYNCCRHKQMSLSWVDQAFSQELSSNCGSAWNTWLRNWAWSSGPENCQGGGKERNERDTVLTPKPELSNREPWAAPQAKPGLGKTDCSGWSPPVVRLNVHV